MATRVCGASAARDARGQLHCWCLGLFCGRGGWERSKEWRADTGQTGSVVSLFDFTFAMGQLDLFSGDAIGEKWRTRLNQYERGPREARCRLTRAS